MKSNRVCIFENDLTTNAELEASLSNLGFDVESFDSAEAFLFSASGLKTPAIYIIDLNLPGLMGMDLVKLIRSVNQLSPIFVVSKDKDAETISKALDCGADDFIPKPYSLDHLGKKITNSSIKMSYTFSNNFDFGLKLVPTANLVCAYGKKLKLTKNEFRILEILLTEPDRIFSREEIMSSLGESNINRTIDAHIANTRKKISDINLSIKTVRGKGYKIESPAEKELVSA